MSRKDNQNKIIKKNISGIHFFISLSVSISEGYCKCFQKCISVKFDSSCEIFYEEQDVFSPQTRVNKKTPYFISYFSVKDIIIFFYNFAAYSTRLKFKLGLRIRVGTTRIRIRLPRKNRIPTLRKKTRI